MEEKDTKKDAIFRIFGILGLAAVLAFLVWSQDRGAGGPHGASHDHADPAQHGGFHPHEGVTQSDLAMNPSGELRHGVREVSYEAFRYGFAPDPLVVRAREAVRLSAKSRDVEHGMVVPELNLSSIIPPGESKIIEFTAPEKPGKYTIYCSVFCGSGHGEMTGTLLVLPAEAGAKHGHE